MAETDTHWQAVSILDMPNVVLTYLLLGWVMVQRFQLIHMLMIH